MLSRIFTTTAAATLALGLAAACSPPVAQEAAITDTASAVKMTLPLAKMANFKLKDITGTFVGMSLLILFVCAALSQLWFSRLP